MKINPLGIQAYQQPEQRERSADAVAQAQRQQAAEKPISVTPQEAAGSKLAVKLPSGDYSEVLTTEERQALEMLFQKFNLAGRFGSAYGPGNGSESENPAVGRVVDVKV